MNWLKLNLFLFGFCLENDSNVNFNKKNKQTALLFYFILFYLNIKIIEKKINLKKIFIWKVYSNFFNETSMCQIKTRVKIEIEKITRRVSHIECENISFFYLKCLSFLILNIFFWAKYCVF